jgi:hypothetical protein
MVQYNNNLQDLLLSFPSTIIKLSKTKLTSAEVVKEKNRNIPFV